MSEAAVSAPPAPPEMLRLRCDLTISQHVAAATGAGFIPVPLLDVGTVGVVQLDLLYRLCKLYHTPFSKQAARSLITALVGGAVPGVQAAFFASSGLKVLPGVGTAAAFFATPVLAGATTYAIGRVFAEHLENGGTLLSFDAQKLKTRFEAAFDEGKQMVGMGKKTPAAAPENPPAAEA